MIQWFRRRDLELLGSIYVYNEHRGNASGGEVISNVQFGRTLGSRQLSLHVD